LNVFKTGINAVSFILSCVLGVFNSPVATPAYGLLGFARLQLRFISENVSLLALFHHPRSQFTKLVTRVLFFRPCHCAYIFVPCLAVRFHVTGDLGLWISSEPSPESLHIV